MEVQERVLTMLIKEHLLAARAAVEGLTGRDRVKGMSTLKVASVVLVIQASCQCLAAEYHLLLSRQSCAGGCCKCGSRVSDDHPRIDHLSLPQAWRSLC